MDCPNDRYRERRENLPGDRRHAGADRREGEPAGADTHQVFRERLLSRNTTLSILGWQPLSYDAHSTLQDVINTPKEKDRDVQRRQFFQ